MINGCNFIDGVNTSLIGYCLIISFSLYYLNSKDVDISPIINFYNLIPVLVSTTYFKFF